MSEDLLQAVEKARTKFSKAIRAYRQRHGSYIDIAPVIPQELLDGCKLFSDRLLMLSSGIFESQLTWAEVGVDQARFSKEITLRCAPNHLHLIDIDTSRIDRSYIMEQLSAGSVTIHEGDSSAVVATFPDDYFDVIYVDGDHYYDGVVKDIAVAHNKIKAGRYMVFNDYAAWSPGFMYKCGVAKAVNEYIIRTGSSVVALALQGSGYYDIAVRVRKDRRN